jgi:hypothetical protein
MAGLEQRAVARASRRQNGYAERDRSLSQVLQQPDARKNREDDGKLRILRQLAGFS